MRKTAIISLLFHILLFIAFIYLRIPLNENKGNDFVIWDIAGPAEQPATRLSHTGLTNKVQAQITNKRDDRAAEETASIAEQGTEPTEQDFPHTAAVDSEKAAIQLDYSDSFLKKNLALQPPQEANEKKIMPMWNGLPSLTDPIVGSNDGDIGTREMARRRQTYSKPIPLTDVGRALAQKLQQKPKAVTPRLHFIPSQAELDLLMIIWPRESITDQDVYRDLDASVHMTAEDVQRVLRGLERKGVLSSELVSPRNEFTIGTPLGGTGIEMSAQNRRNRIFRYKSLIDRQHMIRFLNAVLDQVQNRRGPFYQPNMDVERQKQDLQEKLVKLADE